MTVNMTNARWGWTVAALVIIITLFHYGTDIAMAAPHTVYRRLYYIPIVIAAFVGGLMPGLVTAGAAAIIYFPHAFLLHHHMDPAPPVDKVMEMVLYLGVGGLSGLLVDRERAAREREAKAALERTVAESTAQRLSGLVHLSRGLAHEIRNPLGGIQGAIEILAEDVPETSPRREMVTVALRETERLNRVLTDFLEFARPRDPDTQPFAATDVARHVAALLEPEAEKVGVSVKSAPARADTTAFADPQQVTQVLVNLARNAIQATPPGGRVHLSVERVGDQPDSPPAVAFEIADTGTGVPPELGDSIYDPYVSGREGGTGLGLGLCSLLARQNCGTLSHRPAPGGGTIFRFTIPAFEGGAS